MNYPPATLLDIGQEFVRVDFGNSETAFAIWERLRSADVGEVIGVVIADKDGNDLAFIEAADLSPLCRSGLQMACYRGEEVAA